MEPLASAAYYGVVCIARRFRVYTPPWGAAEVCLGGLASEMEGSVQFGGQGSLPLHLLLADLGQLVRSSPSGQ
jgi:hypothetical protein